MAVPISEGAFLWEPSEEIKQRSNLTKYMRWLEIEKGLHFDDSEKLWEWSVHSLEEFWASIWEFFHIKSSKPYKEVLAERKMPGAQWFTGAEKNNFLLHLQAPHKTVQLFKLTSYRARLSI